jgi:hypothetical protein
MFKKQFVDHFLNLKNTVRKYFLSGFAINN